MTGQALLEGQIEDLWDKKVALNVFQNFLIFKEISSISFFTLLSILFGNRLDRGNGRGRFDFTRGFGVGFDFTSGLYFVGFKGSGNNLINSDLNLFAFLPLGRNFIFLLGTGASKNVFSNDLFLFLLIRFSITIYCSSIFFLNYKNS